VFVDAWAFEALAARAQAARAGGDPVRAARASAAALALHAGELLGDEPHPFAVEPRARLAAHLRRLRHPEG
jgi:hypothetical protein